jgi:hypothetical protein
MKDPIIVNGRKFWFDHISDLKHIAGGRWTVLRHGVEFRIEGGKRAGGTRRDWFLEGGNFNGPIDCTSLVDALRCLEGM